VRESLDLDYDMPLIGVFGDENEEA